MNQPALPVPPQVPPQPAIVVIYLTDSDSEDELEEPEAPPAPVAHSLSALEELEFPPPNCEDFWNNFRFESQLFQDPDPEPEPPTRFSRPEPNIPGESAQSDDHYATIGSCDPYWIESIPVPKRRCYCLSGTSAQSSAEE
jgi:hypothetical protein